MINKNNKLNKLVLYVSSFALILFGILYSFGEVKASEEVVIENTWDALRNSFSIYNNYTFGQSFTATSSNISAFSFRYEGIYKYDDVVSGNYTFCLNPNEASMIGTTGNACTGATILATGTASITRTEHLEHKFTFPSPINLEIGEKYAFVLTNPNDPDTGITNWSGTRTNSYDGGIMTGYNMDGGDAWFKVYANESASSPSPVSNASIYWAGVGSHWNQSYDEWSIPVYYDFCDVYQDVSHVDISFCNGPSFDEFSYCYNESYPVEVIKDYDLGINPSPCSGVVSVKGSVNPSDLYSGYLYPLLTLSGENFERQEVVGDSFYYQFSEYVDTIGNSITPLIINNVYSVPLNSTSSSIVFRYNIPDFDYTASSSEICLYNMESSSKTDFCISTASSYSTTSSILLEPVFTNFDQYFQLAYFQNDIMLLSSDTFRIVWGLGRDDIFALIEDSENTASSSLSQKLLKPIWSALQGFVFKVAGKVFPFNVITFIDSAWKESASNASSFSIFRIMDNDNNIIISLPESWYGQGKTMLLFGPALFNQSAEMTALFADIRQLSKYFLVALFIFALYKQSRSFLVELNE